LVLLGVLLAADAKEAPVEQPHRACEDALAARLSGAELPAARRARLRQRPGEVEHLLELLAVAPEAPLVVVAVLLPPTRIRADRLDVAVRQRADPDVLPGGRDRKRLNSRERLGIVEASAAGIQIREAAAAADAANSGRRAVRAAQSRHGCAPTLSMAQPKRCSPFLRRWRFALHRGYSVLFSARDMIREEQNGT